MRSIRVIAVADTDGNMVTLWHDDPDTANFVFKALERLNRGTRFRARMVTKRVPVGLSDEQVTARVRSSGRALLEAGHTIAETGAPTLMAFPDLTKTPEAVLARVLAQVDSMDVYGATMFDHGWDPMAERAQRLRPREPWAERQP